MIILYHPLLTAPFSGSLADISSGDASDISDALEREPICVFASDCGGSRDLSRLIL